MITSVRNGSDVTLIPYWVNENDEVSLVNPQEQSGPPPAASAKKDAKKAHDY